MLPKVTNFCKICLQNKKIEIPTITKTSPKVTNSYQMSPKATKSYQKLPKLTKSYQKLPKNTNIWQKLLKSWQ